jgi:hypothetical protein
MSILLHYFRLRDSFLFFAILSDYRLHNETGVLFIALYPGNAASIWIKIPVDHYSKH